jgi:predicted O-methyltransferase YrrM
MTLEELIAKAEQIRPTLAGWCSAEKTAALIETIVSRKPQLCVEIGVFGGSSLIPQALALNYNGSGRVVGIDPWAKDAALEEMIADEHKNWWSKVDLDSIMAGCEAHIVKHKLSRCCDLRRAKAEDVVEDFADASIDLLHIDGNHSEALSFKDASLYLPKVKPGGLIFFDDIWWNEGGTEPTTRKAIVFLKQECTTLRLVGDCMILQKNG